MPGESTFHSTPCGAMRHRKRIGCAAVHRFVVIVTVRASLRNAHGWIHVLTSTGEDRVKRAIATLFVLAACHSGTRVASAPAPVTNGSQTGAADPVGAVRGFLAAAKQQDLQAMSGLW